MDRSICPPHSPVHGRVPVGRKSSRARDPARTSTRTSTRRSVRPGGPTSRRQSRVGGGGAGVWHPKHTTRQAHLCHGHTVAAEPAKEEAAEVAAAPAKGAKKGVSDELKERNRKGELKRGRVLRGRTGLTPPPPLPQALEARKKKAQQFLPEGWRKVESNSRRGEYVYENEYTGE